MRVDATSPYRRPIPRTVALLLASAALFLIPAAARAGDLIQLNGDLPVTLSGGVGYGLLYLDGDVRLAGDTSISATDVFIGPDASLQTCYDAGTNGNTCTAGRSLTITASGGVAISPAIDLRGAVGPNRPGGSLVIHAARVALGGGVETAGTNAPSGGIVIDSAGLVVTQTLHAPGNNIIVHGTGGVTIGGDVWSAGSDSATNNEPGRVTSGGPVDIASAGGDVSVLGAIASWGRDVAGAGQLEGGNGGPVSVSGGDVQVSGGIDSRPGRGVDISAGKPGTITVAARGGLVVSGPVDASGDVSTSGYGSSGAAVRLSAAGALSAGTVNSMGGASANAGAGFGGSVTLSAGAALGAGAINTSGAGSPMGGTMGGAVGITGASVALGAVSADAGDASSDPAAGNGDHGGAVAIKATGNAGVGAISSRGGSGRTTGVGGMGGSVTVTGARVTTGAITTLAENLSGAGGGVALAATTGLLVGGAIDTSGANGGNGNPGGPGGAIVLSVHGPLTLGGRLRAEGGTGGNGSAAGGNGGSIELVVSSIASSIGVLSGGGNGGQPLAQAGARGRGGDGGRVRVWSQLPSLILLQLVDSTGGAGDPNGTDGPQQDEAAPSNLVLSKSGALAFTPHSPEADGYRVFQTLPGAPAKLLLETKATTVTLPKIPACIASVYTVSAFQAGLGWQTDPIGPVTLQLPPSADQACTDAPQVTLGVQKLTKRIAPLRRKKWRVPVRFLSDGMGIAHVVLSRKQKQLATADKPLGAARRNVSVPLTIPKNLRRSGTFTVTVTGTAPIGKARSKSTLTLEVKK